MWRPRGGQGKKPFLLDCPKIETFFDMIKKSAAKPRGASIVSRHPAAFISRFRRRFAIVLFFPACQENSNDCPNQENRRCPDKEPFKGMECRSQNGGFRVVKIPPQIRAF